MDVMLICPVFHEGELFCWVTNCLHQYDVGGITPSSFCPSARDSFDEGLLVPPIKIVENDEIRRDIEAIYLRASRRPDMVALDFRAQMAGNMTAKARVKKLIEFDEDGDDVKEGELLLDDLTRSARTIRVNADGRSFDLDLDAIEKMASMGMTMRQIADFYCVPASYLQKRRKACEKLDMALARGKSQGVERVTTKLMDLIDSGNLIATLFYLKCQAGWREADKLPKEKEEKDQVQIYLPDNKR
jgi:hypothetical protein